MLTDKELQQRFHDENCKHRCKPKRKPTRKSEWARKAREARDLGL